MSEKLLLFILLVHFVADFVLQSDRQAKGKSTDVLQLTAHIIVYTLFWGFCLLVSRQFSFFEISLFMSITFSAHWITDYCTSRMGKPYWAKGDYHNGFLIVGADQILHYVQLYYTLKLIL